MARLTMGHIKLFRKIQEWEWYGDPIMVAFWVHLLVNANYEDKKWRGMEIKRGEFVTSLSALASETGISVSQVRTCLNRMRDSKQITIVSTNKMTKITICNYDAYQAKCKDESQADSTQNDMPLDIPRDNQIATMEEYKEGKTKEVNKEKKTSNDVKESRKRFVPPTADEVRAYCQENGYIVDAEYFVDYYEQGGWVYGKARTPMKDWKAAVRQWASRDKKRQEVNPAPAYTPPAQPKKEYEYQRKFEIVSGGFDF